MPKFLFSNDQRISVLAERIKWVANYIKSGKEITSISDKSDNNNASTLEFYYNLYNGTLNTEIAVASPEKVIRNFVLKFQYPNTRTQESLQDTINENVFLAPFRMVSSLLVALKENKPNEDAFLTLQEILYYVFTDEAVCKKPSVNPKSVVSIILDNRTNNKELQGYIDSNLEWKHSDRQVREMMSVLTKCTTSFKLSKGLFYYNPTENDKEFISNLITYNYFWIPSNSKDFELSQKEYISYMNMADTPYNVVEFSKEKNTASKKNKYPLQQITYGAPGTGKSHGINTILKTTTHVRTTFHPDSDYASFVGAYKPTMVKPEKKNGYSGVIDSDDRQEQEELIAYKFVPQAFIKAYVSAWKNYPKETVLVIEEINRGNCAQIFGDLFQLLDRKDNGFSSYPIDADADIAQYLQGELNGILANKDDVAEINNDFSENYPDGIVKEIKDGTKLLLPNNLYIWATMNTSDQSLFPIDSAFKRRWDWKFVKISDAHKGWKIHFGKEECDWWEFIKQMNKIIAKETSSDDKKLGYFFCKPSNEDEDFINEERFVGKVLFYLWNDVFKDGETKYFKVSDNPDDEPTFEAFYNDDCTPCVAAIRKFIVGIVGEENIHIIGGTDNEMEEELDDDASDSSTWNEKRYKFWSEFLSYANNNSEWTKFFSGVKTPSKGSFKDYSLSGLDFYLCTMIRCRDKNAKVAAYWNKTSESYNKLLTHRNEIEAEMEVKYEWNNEEHKTSSNITETMPNVDFGNEDNWQAVFDFFIDRLLRMREVFTKYAQM